MVESTLQVDFENTWDEDRVTLTIPNATSLIYPVYLITTMLMKINTVAAQTTKVTLEIMKVRLIRCLRKREKVRIIQNGQQQI